MDYFGILTTITSHIVGALYIQKQKYNKLVSACLWGAYAILCLCLMTFQNSIVFGFFGMLFMQAIIFCITSAGPIGEKIFLILTYANSFCMCIGASLILSAFIENKAYLNFFTVGILVLTHIFLCKFLIPTYNKSNKYFTSGWSKLNFVLVFFIVRFFYQYALTGINTNSISNATIDFVIFGIIFYLTLILILDTIKRSALMNKQILENAELKRIAYIDVLTNMQNRVAYMKFTAGQIIKHKNNKDNSSFEFVMMDIDGFKEINDTKGHAIGDKTLQCVGTVINEHFKNFKCECFRIGGDEFVLLFENMQIPEIEHQIRKMIKKIYNRNGITMSYGCCEVDFSSEKPFEEAYKKADELMYYDKEQKKVHISSN